MSKFKIGDKVRCINKRSCVFEQTGTILDITKSVHSYRVKFEYLTGGESFVYCTDEEIELAEPTTLERLAELEKSGEPFMLKDYNACCYRFTEEKLVFADEEKPEEKTSISLNAILEHGIKEIPWKPKEGEEFFFINAWGRAEPLICYHGFPYNDNLLKSGNYFRTKELAEAVGIAKILKEANHG